jgi:hypothetical protein
MRGGIISARTVLLSGQWLAVNLLLTVLKLSPEMTVSLSSRQAAADHRFSPLRDMASKAAHEP